METRSRELLPTIAQFMVLSLVIANFAFDLERSSPTAIAPGILWLVLVFAGLVAFGRTFGTERDQGTLDMLRLTPTGPAPIFLGKALAALLMMTACELVLVPGLALFFGTPAFSPALVAALILSTAGMAMLGCLFSALAAQTRARELLLPVLALPLWIPYVVVGGRAVQLALAGAGSNTGQALLLLLDFDVIYAVTTALTVRYVLDD